MSSAAPRSRSAVVNVLAMTDADNLDNQGGGKDGIEDPIITDTEPVCVLGAQDLANTDGKGLLTQRLDGPRNPEDRLLRQPFQLLGCGMLPPDLKGAIPYQRSPSRLSSDSSSSCEIVGSSRRSAMIARSSRSSR